MVFRLKYKILVFMLFFLPSMAYVNADGVILREENVQNEIHADGYATFDLVVTNDDRTERDFFITFPYSTDWRVNVNPYLLKIPSMSSKVAVVQTFSLNDRNIGAYELILNVKSRDGRIDEKFLYKVKVFPFSGNEVSTQLVFPDRIDPRAGGKVKLKLENLRKTDFDDLEVVLKSEGVFVDRRFIDLKSRGIKIEEYDIVIPENLEPGNYDVEAVVKYGNRVIGLSRDSYVLAGFSDVVESTNFDGGFLKKEAVVKKINGGTQEKNEEITITLSFFKKWFTKFDKQPNSFVKTDDGYNAKWNFILGPGESFSVKVFTDYTVFFWSVVVLALVLLFVIHSIMKKIVVSKGVINVKRDRDGISGMKVVLHIRNRSRKNISDINVIDVLPSFVGTSPHSFGTLHPTKVSKTILGNTKLTWHMGSLQKGEERIVSYVATSRLSIIGNLILPSTVVKYNLGNKSFKSRSNKITLFASVSEELS